MSEISGRRRLHLKGTAQSALKGYLLFLEARAFVLLARFPAAADRAGFLRAAGFAGLFFVRASPIAGGRAWRG